MPPIRCHNKTTIDGLEWYCNRDKGHSGDHMYIVDDEENPAKRWKQ